MNHNIIFKNPPITEAVLDIRVNLPKEVDVHQLEKFQEEIEKEFPTKKVNTKWETSFQLKVRETPQVSSKSDQNGYIFISSDNKKIVQARMDGFTFNKLKQYDNWESFSKEAKKFWERYIKIAKPIGISRVALRYINLIELPRPAGDLKEYFLTGPEIAPGIPQGLAEFFMRIVIPDVKTQNTAIIIETVDVSKLTESIFPLIFDIDVFRLVNITAEDSDLWKIFESLREYKNQIFMNSFTNKTKELFK